MRLAPHLGDEQKLQNRLLGSAQRYWSMDMPSPLVNEILFSLNREVLNQLDLARSIQHPGESGRAREKILTEYLCRLIPQEYGIDTGFVFDARGQISRQIDLVIYRKGYYPIFQIGGIKHFMVESVAAIIENKASITARDRLLDALENIRSVKALDRTNDGTNYIITGGQRGKPVNPDEFQHQVFGAIATEKSLSQDSLKDVLLYFLQDNKDRRHWLNLYVDVRGTAAHFIKGVPEEVQSTVVTSEAECLALTDPGAEGHLPPLLELTFELVNYLRIAPIIDYSPVAYLGATGGPIKWWRL